ncbi:MAG: valine--tRNA ligase, partial [Bacteroidota bacterium]
MLASHYHPEEFEDKWYQHWMEQNYFASQPDDREPYTIVIPPPNVTGVLHMGHMLNNSIQDILIRKARLEGKNACWVPGTDHASIATEAKVVKMLRAKGIRKADISRDEFLKYAWEWKDKYGGIILDQLKKLGASADWSRTRFTMEPALSKAVLKVFVDLHKKGKIYRGKRMTNWDPEALTVLSNEEVIYKEERSKLYHVRYKIEGTKNEWVTIATTRPETILGDSAVAVNPKDERYTHLQGKRVIVPMVNRSVPIIFDRYVEIEFGTGALKVTPAHDMNDNEIGARHSLETIDVFNDNGTMSEAAGFYIGEDRFVVRKKIVKDLEAAGHIVEIEDYTNNVGRSERTNAIIEPRLTLQWFLGMKDFASTALKAVKSGEVRFYPEHFWNMYYNWLNEENIRDWCISRQLWWGQRIPAYYYDGETYVAETGEEALEMAKAKTGNADLTLADLQQDEDVLDTWFSSWLWPISVFDGFDDPTELRYYYPTNA